MSDRSANDALYISIFPYQWSLNYSVFVSWMIHFWTRSDDLALGLCLLGMTLRVVKWLIRHNGNIFGDIGMIQLIDEVLVLVEVAQSCSFFITGLCGLVLVAAVVLGV